MAQHELVFNQVNFGVKDMDATVAFYRRLGLTFDAEPGAEHVAIVFPGGEYFEFDTIEFLPKWDSGWNGSTGGNTVLGFAVPTRDEVDEIYRDMTEAGYRGHQPPYDPFWGARYAIIDDPDGNPIGLMSPIDAERRFWPPVPPAAE